MKEEREGGQTLIVESDGTVIRQDGSIVFFSIERFEQQIVLGDCCFLCGVQRESRPFNDEHVLPRWLLKRFDLFDRPIVLPNGQPFNYSRFKIPCCQSCNSIAGELLEQPVRNMLLGGYEALSDEVRRGNLHLLFKWCALVFLKAQLRDRAFRVELDERGSGTMIGDSYRWRELHHVHCVARSFLSGVRVTPEAIGSVLIFRAKNGDGLYERFDYLDLHESQSVLLRVDDIAIVAVLDDSRGVLTKLSSTLKRLEGELSPLQLREILAHASFINESIKVRPAFRTCFEGRPRIDASVPDSVELEELDYSRLGELKFHCCKDILDSCIDKDIEEIKQSVLAGDRTFLFGPNGEFASDSMTRQLNDKS